MPIFIKKVFVNILIQELPHRHAHFYQKSVHKYFNKGINTAEFCFYEMYSV